MILILQIKNNIWLMTKKTDLVIVSAIQER